MGVPVPLDLWFAGLAAIAFVVLAVVAALWRAPAGDARGPVITGLTVWLAADIVIGAFGGFAASTHRRVPLIALGIALPLVVGIWLSGRPGRLGRILNSISLPTLVGVQVYRVAGVIFLVAWAQGVMPGAFALPVGIGDLAVGLAAPAVAARLRGRPQRSTPIAVIWNFAGIADLVIAVSLGFFTSPSPFQQLALGHPNGLISEMPAVLIPTFAVPLSIVLHVAALRRLSHSPVAETTRRAATAFSPAPGQESN